MELQDCAIIELVSMRFAALAVPVVICLPATPLVLGQNNVRTTLPEYPMQEIPWKTWGGQRAASIDQVCRILVG